MLQFMTFYETVIFYFDFFACSCNVILSSHEYMKGKAGD